MASSCSICRMTQSSWLTVSWWLPALSLAPSHHRQDVLGWPFMDAAPRPLAFGRPCGFGCEVEPLMGMQRGWQKWDKVFPGVLRCNKTRNQSVQLQGCLLATVSPVPSMTSPRLLHRALWGSPSSFQACTLYIFFFFLPDSVQKC